MEGGEIVGWFGEVGGLMAVRVGQAVGMLDIEGQVCPGFHDAECMLHCYLYVQGVYILGGSAVRS